MRLETWQEEQASLVVEFASYLKRWRRTMPGLLSLSQAHQMKAYLILEGLGPNP